MAKRRCIGVDVYENGAFLKLSDKAKVLYAYFILRTDDEGVIINPETAMLMCSAGEDTLRELTDTEFVIEVEGMYVIRHWHVHNKIPPSKMTKSVYEDVIALLRVDRSGAYVYDSADSDNLQKKSA